MPFVKRRGRGAADLWATVPPWCPSAGEVDEREPTARKPAAPVRLSGSSINPEGRIGAEGLLLRQTVLVAQTLGKSRHVAAYLFIGDLRVNLGGLDVRVTQQTTDGFDRHTLRKRDSRGEGVPGKVEGEFVFDAALPADLAQDVVAMAVAGHIKDMVVEPLIRVFLDDAFGNIQQADAALGIGFLTPRDNPKVAVEHSLKVVRGQVLHVGIGQPRKDGEDEQIADAGMRLVGRFIVHHGLDLLLREITPVYAFGRVDIARKRVERQAPVVAGNGDDMFQDDHVAPHGICAAFLLRAQEILEIVDKGKVQFFQRDVLPVVGMGEELPHALAHAAVLFPRGDLTTETHLFPVFDIVLFEEFQQRFLLYPDTEVGIPQFGCRDIAVRLHQLLIAAVHLDADFIHGKVDLHGLDALARRPAVLHVPQTRRNVHFATELFDLAIYCKTAHQRQIAVGTGAAFLHVK